ncbi:sporulation protein YunB [Paenibacillus dakarensis]|uniref:sporulation protein YunB n=1 Tax=Paenibacillus dakarensis TaxID=1527293 RepID=UPI0006D59A22|nr:sporulation protein YunB [Paenibacillus dakarensis]
MRRKKWGTRRFSFPSLPAWNRPRMRRVYKKSKTSAFKSFGNFNKPVKVSWSQTRSQAPKPRSRRKWWLIASLIFLFAIVQLFLYVERNLRPPIMHLAQIRVKQIATEAINKAITNQVAQGKQFDNLVNWKTDSSGKVTGFMLNYGEHLRITSYTTQLVQETLESMHKRKEHIPLGQVLKSPIVASFGPQIPVKIEPQGAVKVQLDTRQQEAGINMILIEVYVHIVTEVAVVVPFDMEPQVVETDIPISYLLVVGDVPMYYYDNQGRPVGENSSSAPSIAIPPLSRHEGNASPVDPNTTPNPGVSIPVPNTHGGASAPSESGSANSENKASQP